MFTKEILDEINKLTQKLATARGLLFDGQLEAEDFALMKKECEEKTRRLESSLGEVKIQQSNSINLDNMVLQAVEALSDLKRLYREGDALRKRDILGSIFRKKVRFDGNEYRTAQLNEAASLIYMINSSLEAKKNGKDRDFKRLSRQVPRAGIEPALALRRTGF
jgi:site-specific DNA recombinase